MGWDLSTRQSTVDNYTGYIIHTLSRYLEDWGVPTRHICMEVTSNSANFSKQIIFSYSFSQDRKKILAVYQSDVMESRLHNDSATFIREVAQTIRDSVINDSDFVMERLLSDV